MLNIIAGRLASDPVVRTIDTSHGKVDVANVTIYISTSRNKDDVPVKITGWGDNAKEMSFYQKGESIHFIGSLTPQKFKGAGMEREITTLGFTVQRIDHGKTLLKKHDELLRSYLKVKEVQEGKSDAVKKGDVAKSGLPLEPAPPAMG